MGAELSKVVRGLSRAGMPAAWGWCLAAVLGCGRSPAAAVDSRPGGAVPPAHVRSRIDGEWEWLCRTARALAGRRAVLARRGGEGLFAPRELAALAEEYERRLIAFINADPPRAGAELSPRQKAALRMKSDEDIVLAHEHIARGGDYQRAIEIYESALAADPQNRRLQAELQQAEAARFVTPERFAQVAKGMAAEQIRRLLGVPNVHNVRSFPDREPYHGIVGWFYPKDPTGAAAAVWFERRGGALAVYLTDWNAVAPGPPAAPGVAGTSGSGP